MSDCCKPEAVLTPTEQPIVAVTNILRGPQGPQGPAGGMLIATAGETINAYTPVYVTNDTAFIASNDDLANFDNFAGISDNSATTGNSLNIATEGFIQNPAWTWSNGLVWLDSAGMLTQTAPIPSNLIYRQFVGIAVSPVKLLLRVSEPVLYNI